MTATTELERGRNYHVRWTSGCKEYVKTGRYLWPLTDDRLAFFGEERLRRYGAGRGWLAFDLTRNQGGMFFAPPDAAVELA